MQAIIESAATQDVRDLHALGSHCGSCGITIDEHTGWVWCDECGGISCRRCGTCNCNRGLQKEIDELDDELGSLSFRADDLQDDIQALERKISAMKA